MDSLLTFRFMPIFTFCLYVNKIQGSFFSPQPRTQIRAWLHTPIGHSLVPTCVYQDFLKGHPPLEVLCWLILYTLIQIYIYTHTRPSQQYMFVSLFSAHLVLFISPSTLDLIFLSPNKFQTLGFQNSRFEGLQFGQQDAGSKLKVPLCQKRVSVLELWTSIQTTF